MLEVYPVAMLTGYLVFTETETGKLPLFSYNGK
jgi:hypothetical protein